MPDSTLLPVGKIRKAHGIRGEVSVDLYADSPELLQDGVFLRQNADTLVFHEIDAFRSHHGSLLVRFSGILDRNAAEALRGCDILIPDDRFPELEDGEIYVHEILGLRVVAEADGAAAEWGTIGDVSFSGGQEVWTIVREGEADVLFPAVPEFVLRFDFEAGVVHIAPPPGLIGLYRP